MTDERMNKHPEFLQETMFQEHGTKVLITNPESDKYLDMARDQLSSDANKNSKKDDNRDRWRNPYDEMSM